MMMTPSGRHEAGGGRLRRHDEGHGGADGRRYSDQAYDREAPVRHSPIRSRDRVRRRSRTPEPPGEGPHRRRADDAGYGRPRDEGASDRDRDRTRKRLRPDRVAEERRPQADDDGGNTARDRLQTSLHAARQGAMAERRAGRPLQQDSPAGAEDSAGDREAKEKANWRNTGLLAAASNSVRQADGTSIRLKYHEPAEARRPSARDSWKLFVFKEGEIVDSIDLNGKTCWLIGRDRAVVDLLTEHPSTSKQHAVIQFRYREKRNEFGDRIGRVKPYLLDLESANGSHLNGDRVPDSRYLELRHKDLIQFGHSTREYVVMLAPRDEE